LFIERKQKTRNQAEKIKKKNGKAHQTAKLGLVEAKEIFSYQKLSGTKQVKRNA